MKLTTYKPKDSMIRLLIASILFFIPLGGFADEKQREIENEALNLVIKKYGKGLENSLKGTGVTPSSVSYTHLTLPTKRMCRSRWSPYH